MKVGYYPVFELAAKFLCSIGRQKFVLPLYTTLEAVDHSYALATFEQCKVIYHPVAVVKVEKILGIENGLRSILSAPMLEHYETMVGKE